MKLDAKGVQYIVNSSIEDMTALGISQVPVLKVDGKLMQFKEAVDWINNQ